jgi:hypothetical protein
MLVRELLAYFRRFAHNHDEQYGDHHDQDKNLMRALASSATGDLAAYQPAFQAVVVAHGPNAGYRGLFFIGVLLQHELYEAAAACADALAGTVPSDLRGGWVRDQALLLKSAALAEAALVAGNASEAMSKLQAEHERIARFAPKNDATDPKEIVDALSMAHKISSRLR